MTSQFLSIKKIDFYVEISEFLAQNHGRGQAFFGDFLLKDFPYKVALPNKKIAA